MPEVFREMAEKSVEQAKDSYARLRTAAEDATDVVEDTYLQATRGATEFNLKAIDAIRTNVNANLDYAREILASEVDVRGGGAFRDPPQDTVRCAVRPGKGIFRACSEGRDRRG